MAASNTIPMGIIKNNKNGVEVLVAEVSSSFGSDETGKVSYFDHLQNNLVLALSDEMWSPKFRAKVDPLDLNH